MREKELLERKNAIYQRIVADGSPAPSHPTWGYQDTIPLLNLTADISAIIMNGYRSHREAYDVINRIKGFYDQITPAELEFINTKTFHCPHCGENLTIDEFYEIKSSPDRMGLWVNGDFNSAIFSYYCKQCIHVAPIVLSSEKPRPGYAYLAYWKGEKLYKIGTSQNPKNRAISLRREYEGIELLHQIPAADMWVAEAQLLSRFLHRHVKNELFDLEQSDVDFILSLRGAA